MAPCTTDFQNSFFSETFENNDLILSNAEELGHIFDPTIISDSELDIDAEELDRMFLKESIGSSPDVFIDTIRSSSDDLLNMQPLDFEYFQEQDDLPTAIIGDKKASHNGSRRRNSQPNPVKHQVKKNVINAEFDPAHYTKSNSKKTQPFGDLASTHMYGDITSKDPQSFQCRQFLQFQKLAKSMMRTEFSRRRVNMTPGHRSACASVRGPSLAQLLGHPTKGNNGPQCPAENTIQYQESLKKLATSMRRTELSRRQVALQRTILLGAAAQLQAPLSPPYPSRQQQGYTVSPVSSDRCRPLNTGGSSRLTLDTSSPAPFSGTNLPLHQSSHCVSPTIPARGTDGSNMNAFLSGSRDTITIGLEKSRRDLLMYMNQSRRHFTDCMNQSRRHSTGSTQRQALVYGAM